MKSLYLYEKINSFDDTVLFYKKDLCELPKGVILIIHGFGEHLGRYEYFTNKLINDGYIVYRFDNRGHGKSKGKRGHLEDFNDLIEDTNIMIDLIKMENKNLPLFILGHSMGGFIAASYGVKYGSKIDGQILIGAATKRPNSAKGIKGNIIRLLVKIIPTLRIKNDLADLVCKNNSVIEEYKKDPLNLKDASLKFYYEFLIKGINWLNNNLEEYNNPCLILHGGDDEIISSNASIHFYENISSQDKEIIIFEGLYHEILNEDEKDEVIEKILKWLNNHTMKMK